MKKIELKKISLEMKDAIPAYTDITRFCVDHIEDCIIETIEEFDGNDELAKNNAYDLLKIHNAVISRNGKVKIITAYVLEFEELNNGDLVASDYDWLADYYWLDTEYNFGDFDVKKCALMRGKRDRNGEKDRDTEEVVAWTAYEDIGIEVPSGEDCDASDAEERIDNWIEEELYFLPEYEVN